MTNNKITYVFHVLIFFFFWHQMIYVKRKIISSNSLPSFLITNKKKKSSQQLSLVKAKHDRWVLTMKKSGPLLLFKVDDE